MMSPERAQRAKEMLLELRKDIESDVVLADGMEFNGRNVGVSLGNLSAAVDALAHVLIEMLE